MKINLCQVKIVVIACILWSYKKYLIFRINVRWNSRCLSNYFLECFLNFRFSFITKILILNNASHHFEHVNRLTCQPMLLCLSHQLKRVKAEPFDPLLFNYCKKMFEKFGACWIFNLNTIMFSTLINHKSVEIIIHRMQISGWLIKNFINLWQYVQFVTWAFEQSQALCLKEHCLWFVLRKYLINFCNPFANLIFLLAFNVEVAEDLAGLNNSLQWLLWLNTKTGSFIVTSVHYLLHDLLIC